MSIESEKPEGYIVVFMGKGGVNSNYKGVITWTDYQTREKFEEYLENTDNRDEVIAEGVSQEDAIKLTNETSLQAYVNASILEATTKDGTADPKILEFKLQNIMFLDPEK